MESGVLSVLPPQLHRLMQSLEEGIVNVVSSRLCSEVHAALLKGLGRYTVKYVGTIYKHSMAMVNCLNFRDAAL